MMGGPLVSIVVNNYNYGRFVGEAIESALSQTYPNTEVVVVDDGSTDGSVGVIEGYGERVLAVLKENGGQASAFNAGFDRCRGEIVIFLDADDYLFCDTVERVVEAWEPGVAKVQYRLRTVDAIGDPLGVYPRPGARMESDEKVFSALIERGSYTCPVTSGNAFGRAALEGVLPMPEEEFRLSADGYLQLTVPFRGRVRSIDEPLAAYRIHGDNLWATGARKGADERRSDVFDRKLAFLRQKHLPHRLTCQVLLSREADKAGYGVSRQRRFVVARYRMALLRLDPKHPLVASDGLLAQILEGLRATRQHTGLGRKKRLLYGAWFLAVGLLPPRLAERIAVWQFVPQSRPTFASKRLPDVETLAGTSGNRQGSPSREEAGTGHAPLVSVVVNNYNYGRFVGEAIESALSQSYANTEVVVVDDGSTDGSVGVIEGYGERVLAVLKENGGQASAFNAGFDRCRGDVICFLDSDDTFYEDKVAETVRLLRSRGADGKDVLLYHDLEVVDNDGSSLGTLELSRRPFKNSLPPNLYGYAREHGYIPYVAGPTSGLAITRSLAGRIFPLPEKGIRASADNFLVKAASLLGEVHEADAVLSTYRVHGENRWYGNRAPNSEAFIDAEEGFLNQRLEEDGKEPVMSFFDSMHAGRWYAHHRRYGDLMRLAFKVPFRHLSPRTVRFSLSTALSAISLLLRPRPGEAAAPSTGGRYRTGQMRRLRSLLGRRS